MPVTLRKKRLLSSLSHKARSAEGVGASRFYPRSHPFPRGRGQTTKVVHFERSLSRVAPT